MLYLIIPPILIVLSAVGIILFLAKKAPQIALIEGIKNGEKKTDTQREQELATAGFFKRRWIKFKSISREDIKHKLLIIMEKLTRRFKVMFLKLENLFTSWSESLRKKRNGGVDREQDNLAEKEVQNEKSDEREKLGIYQRLKRYKTGQLESQKKAGRIMDISQEVEEKVIEPIISKKMVTPSKIEVKDRLEKLLIERIALNPKDLEAYERLGEYYFEIENYNYAKECFKQVIKLDPKNSNVKYKMRKLERLLWKGR